MEVKKCFAGFSRSCTILHAARNGHISIFRQRALACRQEGVSLMSLLSLKSFYPRAPQALQMRHRASARKKPCKCALARRAQEIGASRLQLGVSVALPPVIKARGSVYRASTARPAILRGLLAVLRLRRVPIFSSISILSIWGFRLNLSFFLSCLRRISTFSHFLTPKSPKLKFFF